MKAEDVQPIMKEVRACAMEMLENASYIERELSNVRLPDALHAQTTQLCSDLIGTKHDIYHELFELDEILASPTIDAVDIASRIEHIVRWIWDDLVKMDNLVTALQTAREHKPDYGLGWMLVTESTLNIHHAFSRVMAAADRLFGAPHTNQLT